MDRSTVYRNALSMLGETNLKEHSGTDGICYQLYPDALRQANSMAHWSFARARRTLSPQAPSTGDGIAVYNLPADCLRVIAVIDPATGAKVKHFSIFGRTLEVYNHSSDIVSLVYTSDMLACSGELPDQAPIFCQYVTTLLASMIAPTITGNIDLRNTLAAEATQLMHQALTADRQQARSNDQHPLENILQRSILQPTSVSFSASKAFYT